jgi:uncharacterized membrane protein YqgA involved in biofilm formation
VTGTIINAAAVLAGGAVGLTMTRQITPLWQSRIKLGIVLLTLMAGLKMSWGGINGSFGQVTKQVGIMLLALILGNATGRLIGIQQMLNGLGRYARERFSSAQTSDQRGWSEGFITCTLLFCVGPMTILGALQDGLEGDFRLLAAKALMDGMACIGFAATFGWGVLLSVIPLVAYQGTITLCAQIIKPHLTGAMIDSISAVGGMIVFCIPLIILEVKKVELANYLPSLLYAPLLTHWWR